MLTPYTVPQFYKDPAAVLDYGFDLTSWLASGETISTLAVTADTGLTVNSSVISGSKVVAWLAGGTVSMFYEVHFQFTTSGGRTDVRSLQICVISR